MASGQRELAGMRLMRMTSKTITMERKNQIGMLAGYYLSRFDKAAYSRFPGQSHAEAHRYLSERIGVPESSIKLWRDEFDPIHANSRKGWHRRRMSPSRIRLAEQLENVSEQGVYVLLLSFRDGSQEDLPWVLGDETDQEEAAAEIVSNRMITGAQAEDLFVAWYRDGRSPFGPILEDCRCLQCGYDFESTFEDCRAFIEVKGLAELEGGMLLTDKEWMTATDKREKYFLILVRGVGMAKPSIEVYRDPTAILSPRQRIATVVQISWTVSSVDPALAMHWQACFP